MDTMSIAGMPHYSTPHVSKDMGDKKLKEAAQGFEAIFIDMVFKSMRSSLDENGILTPKSQGEKMFEDLLYTEYSNKMSKTGKFGLADLIYNQIKKQS